MIKLCDIWYSNILQRSDGWITCFLLNQGSPLLPWSFAIHFCLHQLIQKLYSSCTFLQLIFPKATFSYFSIEKRSSHCKYSTEAAVEFCSTRNFLILSLIAVSVELLLCNLSIINFVVSSCTLAILSVAVFKLVSLIWISFNARFEDWLFIVNLGAIYYFCRQYDKLLRMSYLELRQ